MTPEERAKAESIIKGENFLIYGEHRSGKSTLASQFKNPCFIAGEPGIKYLKVPDKAKKYVYTLSELKDIVSELMKKNHDYNTVVFDTIDSFNSMISDEVCARHDVDTLMDTDRKVGYDEVRKELHRIINPIAMDKDLTLIMLMHLKLIEIKKKNEADKYNRATINLTDKSKELIFTYPHHIMLLYFKDKDGDNEERRLKVCGSKYCEGGSWNPNLESKQDIPATYEAILEGVL